MFRLGGKQTIGMDVDRGAIKAAQISKSSDGYVLTHVGYHRLPEGVIVDGEVADSELLAREIQSFWGLHSFKGKNVVLGVSGSNVIVRFVDFPRLSSEDLESAMSFHAEEHIPMPIDEVVLDHVVLGPSKENTEEDRVLLVGAHREMISGYADAVRGGGLKPVGIDVKALSLTRSTMPDSLFDGEEAVILLDVGTELTNLVVMEGSSPALAQFIPIGFRDFVKAVGETSGLDDDEAEKQVTNPQMNIAPAIEDPDYETGDAGDETAEADILEILPSFDGVDAEPEPYDEDPAYEDEPISEDELTYENDFTYDEPSYEDDAEIEDTTSEEDEAPAVGESSAEDESSVTESEPQSPVEAEEDIESGEQAEIKAVEEPESAEEAEAESLTEEMPPVELDPALAYDVRRGLEEAATRLARDVERSVEYHNSRPNAIEVSRVVLSGEGALVKGLGPYLGELLGIRTEPAHPTAKLTGNRSNVSDEQLAVMEPVLAIALGLAMDEE